MRREMKLFVCCLIVLFAVGGATGCAKKQEVGELAPSSEEASTTVVELSSPVTNASQTATSQSTTNTIVPATAPVSAMPQAASLMMVTSLPQDSLQRTRTIQLALKQAGYYGGNVDGKSGPLTQKAVEDFQKANGLKADGKVGPVTWAELGKYLPQETKSQ